MADKVATRRRPSLQPHRTVRFFSSSFFFHLLLFFFLLLLSGTLLAKAADTTYINISGGGSSSLNNTSVLPCPVRSLSGAAHLVVAAGSVGIYHVDMTDLPSSSPSHLHTTDNNNDDGEEEESSESKKATKLLDGALLYFAPVSPYYFFLTMPELAEHAAEGDGAAAASVWWPYAWSDERGYAPCQGYKKQDRIAPIEESYVTVRHARRAEAGLICFSHDGVHYSPTGMTYEVVDVTVEALLPITPESYDNNNSSTRVQEEEEDEDEEEDENVRTHKELRVLRRSSGVWQLLLSHADHSTSTRSSDDEVTSGGVVRAIRLASSAHCMRPTATLGAQDLPVTQLPISAFTHAHWRFTTLPEEVHGSSSSSSRSDGVIRNESVWAVVYHNADVIGFPSHTDGSSSSSGYDEDDDVDGVAAMNTFHVCIAVTKTAEDIARRYPVLHCGETNTTNNNTTTNTTHHTSVSSSEEDHDRREGILVTSYPSSQEATYVMEDAIRHRLCARGSLTHSLAQPMTVYTLLPALRVVLQEPPVTVRGFWLLAPQSPLTLRRSVYLVAAAAGHAGTHYKLCETHGKGRREAQRVCTSSLSSSSASPSSATGSRTTLRVTQYSSPVLVFDGRGLETGMLLSLTRTPGQCTTYYSNAEAKQRLYDMAVPLSPVWLNVLQDEGDVVAMTRRKMYMAQLDLRHTAMSDTTSTTTIGEHNNNNNTTNSDTSKEEETWYVCFSYSTMSPQFVLLRGLRLIVRPLRVWGLTAFEPGAGLPAAPPRALYADTNNNDDEEEGNVEARTHVRVPIGWQGMLVVWGMDLSYWSQETFDHSVITLVPEDGNGDNNNNNNQGSSNAQGAAKNESLPRHYLRLVRPLQDSLQQQQQQQPQYSTHNTTTSSNCSILYRSGYGWYAPHVVLVPSSSSSSSSAAAAANSDMFAQPTAQPLRLCLAVPPIYSNSKGGDVTLPRTLLNDVRVSIELPSITAIGTRTHEANVTYTSTSEREKRAVMHTITLAEESDDVVLPVYGDRLHTAAALFLMRPDATLCSPLASAHDQDKNNHTRDAWEYSTMDELMAQSLARIRLIAPYDLPARYHTRTSHTYYNSLHNVEGDGSNSNSNHRNSSDDDESTRAQIAAQPSPAMYLFLPRAQFTTRRAADALFGRAESAESDSNASDGLPAGRTARSLCLFIPSVNTVGEEEEEKERGRGVVLPIPFQLIVAAPLVRRMANVPADAALVQHALRSISLPPRTHIANQNEERKDEEQEDTNTNNNDEKSAFVVYGAHMDLLVTGIGLVESETELVPAQDCGNPHTFLFPVPLRASAWPSLSRDGRFAATTTSAAAAAASAERVVDSSESLVSWFVTLTTWHTTQLPLTTSNNNNSDDVQSGQVLGHGGTEKEWVWCVHYRDAMEQTNHTLPHAPHNEEGEVNTSSLLLLHAPSLMQKRFVSTGLPYKLVIPAVEDVRVRFPSNLVDRTVHLREENKESSNNAREGVRLPVQDRTLGEWAAVELRGPLVELTFAAGYALSVQLVERDTRCAQVQRSAAASSQLYVVNGSTVLLPRLLAVPGQYKLCARLRFPPTAQDVNTGAHFELQQISLDIVPATYIITALNHTPAQAQPSVLTLEHGEQAVWPVEGTWLSVRTRLRLVPYGTLCHSAPAWPDLALHNMPPTTTPQYTTAKTTTTTTNTNTNNSDEGVRKLYVTLEQSYLRLLPAPGLYQLCLKPHRARAWRAAEQYMLQLRPHTRRPTHYDYFAHDGSEDVAAMAAVGPTRLTRTTMSASHTEANNDHSETTVVVVDIVAPAATTTQLRLWCATSTLHTNTNTNNSSSVSLCQARRRVMFVKPLASHNDPCFVDAKAVSALVQRGPYVIEADGLLTLPQNASTPGRESLTDEQRQLLLHKEGQAGYMNEMHHTTTTAAIAVGEDYPSVREPWRMCLETGPERWRPSVQPRIQLRYTSAALPRGFRRDAADVASAMSMPLDEAHIIQRNKEISESDGQPRANQTLTVYVNDSSRVYYLSGYGIRAGLRLRFGARCTLSVAEMQAAMAKAGTRLYNASELLLAVQGVHNALLYERPLRIENDDGLFVLPREHLTEVQEPVAMCYTSDEQGLHYVQSTLLLHVLPSQLRPRHYLHTDTHVLEHILARTLLVPQGSAACVNVSDLLQQAASKAEDEQSNNNKDEEEEEGYVHELAVGSRVVLARNCRRARPHGPLITITQHNMLNLTKAHTLGSCAGQTLSVCVQLAHTGSSSSSDNEENVQTEGPVYEEEIWHESADTDDGERGSESGQEDLSRAGYRASGIFVRIVRVQLEAVTRHTPPLQTKEAGLSVVQRSHAGHGALLTVHFAHTPPASSSFSSPQQHGNTLRTQQLATEPNTNEADDDDMMAAETVLQDLDTPAALVFFGLVQLRAGVHCAENNSNTTSSSSQVRSDVVMRGVYNSTGLYISGEKGDDGDDGDDGGGVSRGAHWYALLPLDGGLTDDGIVHAGQQSSHLARTASLCLSVDGGRHFYAVDQSHVILVQHAATLALQKEPNTYDGVDRQIRAYAGGSWAAGFYDTRCTPTIGSSSGSTTDAEDRTALLLSTLVRDVLWSGNVYSVHLPAQQQQQQQQQQEKTSTALTQTQRVGFMSDGILYLVPTYGHELSSKRSAQASTGLSGDLVLQQTTSEEKLTAATTLSRTGLQLRVHLPYLRCVRGSDRVQGRWYVRRSNAGQLLALETTSEACVGGLVPGMRLQATRITTTTTSSSTQTSKESYAEDSKGVEDSEQSMNAAPVRFVLSVLSVHTRETWPFAALHLGLQLPASLSYRHHHNGGGDVSGTYALCIMADTASLYNRNTTIASRLQITVNNTQACLPTAVRLIVVDDTTHTNVTTSNSDSDNSSSDDDDDEALWVYSLNGQTRQVRVVQGSHKILSVDGPVAGLGEGAVRIALVPLHTSELNNSMTTNTTAYEALCANVITREGRRGREGEGDDEAAVRWLVVSDSELRLPAPFTTPQYKKNSSTKGDVVWPAQAYVVCYSVDFGLRFRPVTASSLTLYVDPPSVSGLTYTSAAQSYKSVQENEEQDIGSGGGGGDMVVRVNTRVTSRTAAQLYRFARTDTPDKYCNNTNTSDDGACDVYEGGDVVQTWQVTQPMHGNEDTEQAQHHRVRSRAAMYYYYTRYTNASTSHHTLAQQYNVDVPSLTKHTVYALPRRPMCLMRLAGSAVDYYGRSWPSTLVTSRKESVKEMPTVVAAVAILRSSRVGQRCNGYVLSASEANANTSTLHRLPSRALVLPVFLLSLQRGLPWSERDAERLEDATEAAMSQEDAVSAALDMNPVLRHTVWANNTRAMRTREGGAEVSLVAFLHRALQHFTSASDGMDEALLVCLSVDGVSFHSPYNRTAEKDEDEVQANKGDDDDEEETCEAALPMYIRMDDTSHGSSCMRDVALTLYFTVTRNTTHAHTRTVTSDDDGDTNVHSLPCLVPSAKAMSRLHSALAAQLGCDPVVLVLELQPVQAHTASTPGTSSSNYTYSTNSNTSGESSGGEGQGDKAEQTHYLFSLSVAADSIPLSSLPLPTHVPKAAADWLLEAVMLLRDNVTGPNIMRTLLSDASAAAQEGECVLELQTMNFTLSNGVDLHHALMSSSSSSSSNDNTHTTIIIESSNSSCRSVHEPRWREALLAIPHRVSDPVPVPPVHLVSDVVWWLLVALVLASPLIVVAVVVAVHRRHARRGRRRVQVAQDVTLVPASTQ